MAKISYIHDLNFQHIVEASVLQKTFPFLRGGGEMGELTRNYDWSGTSVGTPDQWPHALKISLGNLLHSRFPMFLFWGKDLTCFYNDAYRPSLGIEGKHPAVGKKGREVWPEIWEFIGPLIDKVMATGEPVWYEDQYLPIYRNGGMEDVYWTFSYSLALDDQGAPGGVLVTCMETTQAVKERTSIVEAKKEAERAQRVYETITSNTPDLVYVFDLNYRFTYANKALLTMWGKTWETAIGKGLLENGYEPWHAELHQREIDQIIATKKPVRGEVAFPHAELGKRIYDYILVPVLGENGEVEAVAGTTRDITDIKLAAESVRESEERFRNLADESPILVFIIDADPFATVSYWNTTWLEYTGQTMEQAIGTAWNGIIHEDDIPVVMQHYRPAFEKREPYFIPAVRVKRHDGQYRWHSFKGNPRYLADGSFNGYVGVGQDIHEQKLAEEALEESERNLRNMILQSPVAMCILLGSDHVVDIANDAMIRLWGKPVEAVMHKPIFEGLPDARQQGLEVLLDKVYLTGETFKAKERPVELYRGGQTEVVYQNFVYEPYRDAGGRVIGVLAVTIDVTEQVVARQKIEQSERDLETALEQMRLSKEAAEVGTFDMDLTKGTMHWDDRCRAFFGISHQEPVTYEDDFVPGLHPDDRERILEIIRRCFIKAESNGDYDVEYRTVGAKDGRVRWVRAKGKVYFDPSDKPIRFIGSVLDITEQVQAIQKIEETVTLRTTELAKANENLSALNKELSRSNKNLEEFAHAASHDLKEPIRKIGVFTQRLKEQLSARLQDAELRSFSRIEYATQRMGNLIDDLLLYSHVSQRPLQMERVDLNKTIQLVLEDLDLAIAEKKGSISMAPLPAVWGYKRQLQQLFQNLISNSLKYSKADVPPHITVMTYEETDKDTSYHVITVQDNGIGFDREYAEKIFQMFSRLHGPQEYSGTGVGLSIAKKIAENHHGFILADSVPDEGSTFKVFLPVISV